MILACHNLSKSFGDQVIVKDGSFHIENHEKAALVGLNGAGKSTILKMIVGQLSPDAGTAVLTKGKTLGYLAQHQEMESGNTIYEEVRTAKAEVIEMEKQIRTIEIELPSLSGDALEARLATYQRLTSAFEHADGYAYKSELTGVLKGLGFTEEEFTKPVDSLSGGQKTRVSLGKLLLTKPDVLLLDEPTNHLDMNSIAWLETYLLNYPGAVLIVSHDRYFLNRVVTKVIEVEQGQLHTYMGNYSDFAVKKEQLREARLKEYLNQQREIKHQEAVIEKLRSFNREKSIKHVPDLCVGKCRIIIGNFFKDRLIHMKDVVFLIVVTNLHIGTQCKGTAVCLDYIVQNLEKRSFSSSVVANDGYMFPTLDFETDVGEKCLWRKGFA